MTQPGLLGNGLGLRGRITGISWLPRPGLLRLTAPNWNISPAGGENSRYPKHCIWVPSPVIREQVPVKPFMHCATNLTAREASSDRFKRPKACKGGPERERAHRFLFRPRAPYSA